MMFHMIIGIPKKLADEPATLDGASVLEAVHLLANLTVGVLEIAYVIDGRVADDDRDKPPEGKASKTFLGLAEDGKYQGVDEKLLPGCGLQRLHQTRLGRVGLGFHTPAPAGVVHRDAPG